MAGDCLSLGYAILLLTQSHTGRQRSHDGRRSEVFACVCVCVCMHVCVCVCVCI